jgi:gamma-glutamylcyclotransferase (GGCT)/AIG2-like uncharacterized protein YtfP
MTTPFYRLYNTGSFPALVNDGNGTSIIGELWEVDDDLMNYLDRIEGVHFGMYAREEVEIMSDGVVPPIPKPIIAYVFQMDTEGMDDCGSSWKE